MVCEHSIPKDLSDSKTLKNQNNRARANPPSADCYTNFFNPFNSLKLNGIIP